MKTIRVGNAAGFWGDNLDAPRLLVEAAGRDGLDYLTLEYLAELTMSILAHLKSRDENAGYVTDVPTVVESLRPAIADGLRVVTNGGGMNPPACARHVAAILGARRRSPDLAETSDRRSPGSASGPQSGDLRSSNVRGQETRAQQAETRAQPGDASLADLAIAAVGGDDLLPRLDALRDAGEEFRNLETGEPLGDLRERVVCANAYLGAAGIVQALQAGARIVVTGRIADASLVVGPAMHEFGWDWGDWNRLAAATVAGHLIECGAQVTGGMYSGWTPDVSLHDVGYPIAELDEGGGTRITKPPGTGGIVTVGTVSEQLVYEIGDPAHYLTPDVDADFSGVTLAAEGADRVRVAHAAGNPAPERYKVSLAYRDGYMVSGTLVVAGPNACDKARVCAGIIEQRLDRAGCRPAHLNAELLGSGDVTPGVLPAIDPPEVVLRISARDASREVLERFSREFAPLVTSGPPGVTGYTGPRSKPHPVMAYWPTTIARDRISTDVTVKTAQEWLE